MKCQQSFFTLSKLTDGMEWMTMLNSMMTSVETEGRIKQMLIFFLSRNTNMEEYCRWTTISIAGWHSGMTGWSSEMTGWHFGMTRWHSGMTGWQSEMVGWHFGMKWWSSEMTGWHSRMTGWLDNTLGWLIRRRSNSTAGILKKTCWSRAWLNMIS